MADQSKDTTTAIGASIVIRGKLKSAEDLVVKGRIEAEVTSSKALFIENSGVIKANVKVQAAKISGVVVGNITAEQKVEIAPDGRVIGDLLAPRIVLNDGAAFRGKIDMQTFDTPRSEGLTPADSVTHVEMPTSSTGPGHDKGGGSAYAMSDQTYSAKRKRG
jgi:cytoskeletal protein CcmA (bactofilin family)